MTTDPDPAVVVWSIAVAPVRAREPGRPHWWRQLVTNVYRDARDARERLRESDPYLQYEREEFDREHPPVRLSDVCVGLSSGTHAPPNWGWRL